MTFNSSEFLLFFLVLFILYWVLTRKSSLAQNILLLIANYTFYSFWDWRFLSLLIAISTFNYLIGFQIRGKEGLTSRLWLVIGVIVNLGLLCVFKYYNFFIRSFIDLFSWFGYELPISSTKIILPIGISFYTFLSLSYLIDIFKGYIKPNNNILEVLTALSFFPIILSGPIQRPASLLPQISKVRTFNLSIAIDGLKQIIWGMFSKFVIADNLVFYVDDFFKNYETYGGSTLLLGAIFYSMQIYADFAGYSNIAIGLAKLLGINLIRNFHYPYFAKNIADFWQRWHISLTSWFRDYVFLPLSFRLA